VIVLRRAALPACAAAALAPLGVHGDDDGGIAVIRQFMPGETYPRKIS
jgi:hypothetical protein